MGRQTGVSRTPLMDRHPLLFANRTHPRWARTRRPLDRWHDNRVRNHIRSGVPNTSGRPIPVIAHRGSSEEAPEHTLAAYRKAIEEGADALECDVRLTADGHLVCVHDRRINRTSNGRGAVSRLELAELATLDFGSWKGGGDEDPYESPDHEDSDRTSVLTLERLLQLVAEAPRPVELAIETKHPTRWAGHVEERLLQLLACHELPAPVRIMSFSARSLHRITAAAPHVPRVLLMQLLLPRHRDGTLPEGVRIAGTAMRILRAHPEYVERAHEAGNEVHAWTVNDPADIELCARLGVDAIITDRPRRVLAQLR